MYFHISEIMEIGFLRLYAMWVNTNRFKIDICIQFISVFDNQIIFADIVAVSFPYQKSLLFWDNKTW